LDAAVALLLEGGIGGVTIDAVSARSGVAKTTIYRHWESREDLLLDTFAEFRHELAVPSRAQPPEARVRHVVRQLAAALGIPEWQRAFPTLVNAARQSEEFAAIHRRAEERGARVLSTVIAEAVAAGALPADTDPEEALLQLTGPLLMAALIRPELVEEAFADRLVDLFFASRAVQGRSTDGEPSD
jgi:AcrR family transcriptional regulator